MQQALLKRAHSSRASQFLRELPTAMRVLVISLLTACALAELSPPDFHGGDAHYTSSGGTGVIETNYHTGYTYNPAPVITKNVYVHLAPEEAEVRRQNRIIAPSQPRQRYKIVFIKTPSQPPPAGAQIQLPPQDEEKTLIYILTKKQDEQADIKIQKPVPTKPSKPEVYFIRYRAQKSSGYGPGSSSGGHGVSSSYGPPSS